MGINAGSLNLETCLVGSSRCLLALWFFYLPSEHQESLLSDEVSIECRILSPGCPCLAQSPLFWNPRYQRALRCQLQSSWLESVPGTQAGERPGASFGPGQGPYWSLAHRGLFLSRIFFVPLDLHISLGNSYVKGMKTGDGSNPQLFLSTFLRFAFLWTLLTWLDNVYFFIFWPCCVACGIIVPRPEIKPHAPAVEVWSLNHWTTRRSPDNV